MGDITKLFDTTRATVLHHLNVLDACGLVSSSKVGRVRTYSLNSDGFVRLIKWFERRRTRVASGLDREGETSPKPPA